MVLVPIVGFGSDAVREHSAGSTALHCVLVAGSTVLQVAIDEAGTVGGLVL